MRVVIETQNGRQENQRVWLRRDSEVRFGRSSWADFSVSGDPGMSALHFAVTVTDTGCSLRDLNSERGVLLNGARVTEAALRDGDAIQAGGTRFSVQIEDAPVGNDHTAFSYEVETLPSELQAYRPAAEPLPVWEIVKQLRTRYHVYLIAFFDNWGMKRPTELTKSLDTIPACDNPRWARFLPLLIDIRDLSNPRDYLDATWSTGNVMALFSSAEKPDLLRSLRRSPATFSSLEQCRFHFENMPPPFRLEDERELAGLLLPSDEACWKLLAFPAHVGSWSELGFTVPPRPPAASNAMQPAAAGARLA